MERKNHFPGLYIYHFLSPTREVHGVEDTVLMGNSLALWSLGEYLLLDPVITLKLGLQNSSYSDSEAEKLTSLCVYTFCAKTRGRGLPMARCFMRPRVRNDPDPGSQALPHAGGSGLSMHGICSQGQMQNTVRGPAELSQEFKVLHVLCFVGFLGCTCICAQVKVENKAIDASLTQSGSGMSMQQRTLAG